MKALHKAVFLDRDGVLTEPVTRADGDVTQPFNLSEFKLLSNAVRACETLRGLNYLVFVVSNQGRVGDGVISMADHLEMHAVLMSSLDIDDAVYALDRNSEYFKPGTMMIDELCGKWGVDREASWMVGDRWRDIAAGNRAAIRRNVFVGRNLSPEDRFHIDETMVYRFADDVMDAALTIVMNDILEGTR